MSWATMGYTTDKVLKPKDHVLENGNANIQDLAKYPEWKIVSSAQNLSGRTFHIIQPLYVETLSMVLTLEEIMTYFNAE